MRKIGKYLLKGLMRLLGHLPLRVHYAVFSPFLAFLAERVICYRTDDVAVNLARAFPDYKYGRIREIKHAFYRHFADLLVETVWFGASSVKRLQRQGICTIANPDVLRELFDAAPSVVVMYSHTGNWELFGGLPHYDGTTGLREDNFCAVYKQLSSRLWDELMAENRCRPLREGTFTGYLESRALLRYAITHKAEKKIYNINTDQRPYGFAMNEMEVSFMHQRCRTMLGAATLARKFGFAVAYLNMKPVSRGHYVFEYTAICRDASQMSAEEIMTTYYRLLEKDLEAMPENYLWTHRRWK